MDILPIIIIIIIECTSKSKWITLYMLSTMAWRVVTSDYKTLE